MSDTLSISERDGQALLVRRFYNYKEECVLAGPNAGSVIQYFQMPNGVQKSVTIPPEQEEEDSPEE
jgi:hypothetical protein